MSDLDDVLIMCGFDANMISLNKCNSLTTLLMKLGVMRLFSILCRSPTIFRYDLDLRRQELLIESKLMLEIFLMYFLIVDKSEVFAGLFIVMTTSLFVMQIKSAITSYFMFFRHLLILAMCILAGFTINSAFDFAIGIITCFLDSPLIIILILSFFCLSLLFLALIIFPTSLADKNGKAS